MNFWEVLNEALNNIGVSTDIAVDVEAWKGKLAVICIITWFPKPNRWRLSIGLLCGYHKGFAIPAQVPPFHANLDYNKSMLRDVIVVDYYMTTETYNLTSKDPRYVRRIIMNIGGETLASPLNAGRIAGHIGHQKQLGEPTAQIVKLGVHGGFSLLAADIGKYLYRVGIHIDFNAALNLSFSWES